MAFVPFHYTNLNEVKEEANNLGIDLNFSNDMSLFHKEAVVNNIKIPNRLAVQPMEGCDGSNDGSPGVLTKRRYERFARGGAGLIWFEAVAVVPEGKASPNQLQITEKNISEFQSIVETIKKSAKEQHGDDFSPVTIMQLTHSGRFSKPYGKFEPIIACKNPFFEDKYKNEDSAKVVSDEELEKLEDEFVKAALFAKRAGFNGVDIKACHYYLCSELLSAFTRRGKYGGDFEGRTRFLLNIIDKVKDAVGKDFIISSRLNIYDGIEFPYGWGVDRENYLKPDFTEPLKLVGKLYEHGVRLIDITMGTPYLNPHVNRPYDKGDYVPPEHPLEGVARMVNGIGEIQKAYPQMLIVGTGYSYLRQFSHYLAAGSLENGLTSLVGFGRMALAYPDFASDILNKGELNKSKSCIACSKCATLLRAGVNTGCVVRDAEKYMSAYKEVAQ